MRLVDGDVPTEGRVEFCRGGQWGTVCNDDNVWDADDVGVVCRQLGNFTLGIILYHHCLFSCSVHHCNGFQSVFIVLVTT